MDSIINILKIISICIIVVGVIMFNISDILLKE
jgi:hypothetical protein